MAPRRRPPWWPENERWPPQGGPGAAWSGPPWWGPGMRRGERALEPRKQIDVGELALDAGRMRTTVSGRPVELTATEFQILATMAREPGRVFTRSQLLDAVHGVAFESYERAIDAHIKNIRRKLEPDPARPRFVQTVYGVGYRVAEQEA